MTEWYTQSLSLLTVQGDCLWVVGCGVLLGWILRYLSVD